MLKDTKTRAAVEAGTTQSEDAQCSKAMWEGLTAEVTFYLPSTFEEGRTHFKDLSVRKTTCAESWNTNESRVFGKW